MNLPIRLAHHSHVPRFRARRGAIVAYHSIALKLNTCVTRNLFSETSRRTVVDHHPHHRGWERKQPMNNFTKGLLVGIGIGLLIAPRRGEETRRMLAERVGQLRGYLPENEQLELYRQQLSERVRDTASTLKDYAQQAASTVKSGAKTTASNLSEIAQNAASTMKRSSEDVADTTKDAINSARAQNQ